MDVLVERVAGLDVGKEVVVVCVRTPGEGGRRVSETRTFRTMSRSLEAMADWLVESGVTLAGMESTATYWKPVFYALEDRMGTWLLNAAHMKAVPGRKSDVKDAEWIAQLLEHGLVAPSFVPVPEIRRLRNLTRYRVQLMGTGPGTRCGWSGCWRTPRSSCPRSPPASRPSRRGRCWPSWSRGTPTRRRWRT